MKQEERCQVLQLLDNVSKQETCSYKLLEEIKACEVTYDFFEDLFEIVYEYPYDEHLMFVRVLALLAHFEERENN